MYLLRPADSSGATEAEPRELRSLGRHGPFCIRCARVLAKTTLRHLRSCFFRKPNVAASILTTLKPLLIAPILRVRALRNNNKLNGSATTRLVSLYTGKAGFPGFSTPTHKWVGIDTYPPTNTMTGIPGFLPPLDYCKEMILGRTGAPLLSTGSYGIDTIAT